MSDLQDIPRFPLQIFFDGSCSVCAAEIQHYLQRNHGGRLVAIDIAAADFDPEPYHIPQEAFMHELHAIDSLGNVYRGVEAFRAIWQAFPPLSVYRLMGSIIGMPLIDPVARVAYKVFASVRPFLPKRNSSCSNGICRIKR